MADYALTMLCPSPAAAMALALTLVLPLVLQSFPELEEELPYSTTAPMAGTIARNKQQRFWAALPGCGSNLLPMLRAFGVFSSTNVTALWTPADRFTGDTREVMTPKALASGENLLLQGTQNSPKSCPCHLSS
jgi:hypothetical protein